MRHAISIAVAALALAKRRRETDTDIAGRGFAMDVCRPCRDLA